LKLSHNISKVFQRSTRLINYDKFSSEQINSFSRKLYSIEHVSPQKAAEKSNKRPNL